MLTYHSFVYLLPSRTSEDVYSSIFDTDMNNL